MSRKQTKLRGKTVCPSVLFPLALVAGVFTTSSIADGPMPPLGRAAQKITSKSPRNSLSIGVQSQQASARMKRENLSPQAAWQRGILNAQIVRYRLSQLKGVDAERGLWNPSQETYAYTGLLWQSAPQVWNAPLKTMTVPLKIRLAQHLMYGRLPNRKPNQRARAGVLLQAALAELPRDGTRFQEVGGALYTLIHYYRWANQPRKAAETALRILDFTKDPRRRANYVLEASRAYRALGDNARADQLDKQIMGYGYGWAIGHTLSDRASRLFSQGKIEEARAVLKQKIPGFMGDQFQVVQSARLSTSYESTGELEQALLWARTAARQFDALKNPIKNHGLEYFANEARNRAQRLEKSQNQPIFVREDFIWLADPHSQQNKQPEDLRGYMAVFTREALPSGMALEVTCNDPRVRVELMDMGRADKSAGRRHGFSLRMKKSSITASERQNPALFDVKVQVRDPRDPERILEVPVRLLISTTVIRR